MKKLLFALLLLLSQFSWGQDYFIEVIDRQTLQKKYVPFVQGITTGVNTVNGRSGNVTIVKNDVGLNLADNTSDISKPISAAVQNAVNNLQALIATKADKGSTGGVSNTGIIDFPDPGKYIMEVRTKDYLKTYNNGTQQGAYYYGGYEFSPGINNSDRPDIIFNVAAYNQTPQGNRVINTDGAWSMRVETHYDIPGYPKSFEPHVWNYISKNGKSHRSLSGYFSTETEEGFWNVEANYMSFFHPVSGKQYASIGDASLQLTATQSGRMVGFQGYDFDHATNPQKMIGLWQIGGASFLKAPGLFDLDAYDQHKQTMLPNLIGYQNKAAAVNAGLGSKNIFWKDNGDGTESLVRIK